MTLQDWAQNDKIIWKASVQHYPIWFLNLNEIDYAGINDVYLPMLREYNFDLYLNGHEHFIAYAYLLKDTPLNEGSPYLPKQKRLQQNNETCAYSIEYFFNDTTHSRVEEWKQGEALHQITTGNTGKEDYAICYERQNLATFTYAQNLYGSWTQVRTESNQITLVTYGYDPVTDQILNLFQIQIKRGISGTDFWLVVAGGSLAGLIIIGAAAVLVSKKCKHA